VRIAVVLFAAILVVACSEKQKSKPGWDYRPAHGAYEALLSYDFADAGQTRFTGVCEGEPTFSIAGGDWQFLAPQFTLTVDDHSWTLPTMQSEHGHYLPVDRYAEEQAIAHAKQRIIFQVGNWRREIQPSTALNQFVRDCG
jgi:hypothetical protein